MSVPQPAPRTLIPRGSQEKEQLKESAADGESEEFDEMGRRRKPASTFVPYNHNPYTNDKTKLGPKGMVGGGGNKSRPLPAKLPLKQMPKPAAAKPVEFANLPQNVRDIKLKYKNRKFVFPLLDQGPNNQFLQLRVALAKAHSMNRTLVLPLWLPHNPKFQHFHFGAPPVPSRDKKLDQISYPFESTFDPEHLAKYVRTIDLPTFRTLSDGHIELCYAESKASHDQENFESYLRLSGIACDNHSLTEPKNGLSSVRFLGFHSYDHEVGNRDRYYEYLRWAPAISRHADSMSSLLFNGTEYAAAHIRLADAHWEHTDCRHTINGVVVPAVSCGDGQNVINYTSLAQEMWYMLKQADKRLIYVSTNMECSDTRLIRISLMLSKRAVKLVCAQDLLRSHIGSDDNFIVSLVEQELCVRSHSFIGSKYSTWTDTVRGLRNNDDKKNNFLFEDLYVLGVK